MARENGETQVRLMSFKEALEQVDVHALKFVFQSTSKLVKLFWLLLFLGGLVAASYYIYQIVEEFQSQPTATKVNAVENETYQYPDMFVCSRYAVDLEKLQKAGASDQALVYAASLIQKPDSDAAKKLLLNGVKDAEAELIKIFKEHQFKTYAEFYTWLAFNFSRVVGEEPSVVDPATFPVYLVANPTYDGEPIPYRLCFQAEHANYIPNQGHYVYLAYEMKKPAGLSALYPSGYDRDSFVVSNDHRLVLEKEQLNLRRNRITTIRVGVKKYINLNTDTHPCKPPEDVHRERYTYKHCRHSCYVQAVQTCTGCTVLSGDTRVDTTPPGALCSWFNTRNLTISCSEAQKPYQQCIAQCLHPCEYSAYEFSLTATVINFTHYLDDRISIWLYYEVDDGILVYEEIPTYTWATMVSNIGGQLGLWCGASLLTGLELIYLLSHVSIANWKAKRRAPKAMEDDGVGSG